MYEVKAENKSIHRHGNTKQKNMMPQILRHGDSFAGRNIKLGYCPVRETGSVVQMERCLNCGKTLNECRCEEYEPDDSGDTTYCENAHEQYLSAPRLRSALGANGKSGEAHHIFPGNIVHDKNLDKNGADKDRFNEAWNGIMLNGTSAYNVNTKKYDIIHEYQEAAPHILHRSQRKPNHNVYDEQLCIFIENRKIKTCEDCMNYAGEIRGLIESSDKDCLDNM